MKALLCCSLLLLLCSVLIILPALADIVTLNTETFADKVKEKDTVWFVKFCVPWCKHCKNLGSLWEDLGSAVEGEDAIEIGQVDCSTSKPVCTKVDIHSYPTFKLFYDGEEVAKYKDEWWRNFGIDDLELQTLAIRILSQTCSSSGCERNWSVFERIHTKRRNRLEHKRLNDLVYTHYNLRLKERQASRKSLTDPISLENIDLTDDWVVEAEDDDAPLLDVDEIDDWMDVADAILDEGEGGAAAGSRNVESLKTFVVEQAEKAARGELDSEKASS